MEMNRHRKWPVEHAFRTLKSQCSDNIFFGFGKHVPSLLVRFSLFNFSNRMMTMAIRTWFESNRRLVFPVIVDIEGSRKHISLDIGLATLIQHSSAKVVISCIITLLVILLARQTPSFIPFVWFLTSSSYTLFRLRSFAPTNSTRPFATICRNE